MKSRTKKILSISLFTVLFIAVLIVTSMAIKSPELESDQEKKTIKAPDTDTPGVIFTGDYLRIGINDGGTLGVGRGYNLGVGFQSVSDTPYEFPSTESLAIGWWGEGYNIAYKDSIDEIDKVAYWQPHYGYPPPDETNIELISQRTLIDDDQKAVRQIVAKTKDEMLQIYFTFTFLKQYPELNLQTDIVNIGDTPVRDIVYKRIVDWDVCTDFVNEWASTDSSAIAWDECEHLNQMVQLTVSGRDGVAPNDPTSKPYVNYVDLYAWDDMTIRSPNWVVQSFVPTIRDYNAAIYYKIGELDPGEEKTVYTVYQSNFPRVQSVPIKTPETPTSLPIEESVVVK